MNKIILGTICGLVFAAITVVIIIFTKYEDRRKKIEAMSAAFLLRFLIGFLIPNVEFGIHPAVTGFLLGLGFNLPFAIINRSYVPIIGSGIAGGVTIGLIANAVL